MTYSFRIEPTYTSPIEGDLAEFDSAQVHYEDIGDTVTAIRNELGESFGSNQGQAIEELSELWDEIADELSAVRKVTYDISDAFTLHTSELQEMDELATTTVDETNQQCNELNEIHAAITRCKNVIRELRAKHDAAADEAVRADIEIDLEKAKDTLTALGHDWEAALGRLVELQDELAAIEEDEEALNQRTAEKLLDIDLRSLRDPGRLGRVLNAAQSAGGWLLDAYVEIQFGEIVDLVKAVDALIDGRYADAMLHFKDALDRVLLKVAVAGLIVAWTFPPAGAALTTLAIVGFAGGALSTAIGFAAWQNGLEHPDTGETTSGWDVGVDAAFTAVQGFSLLTPAAKALHAPLGSKFATFGDELAATGAPAATTALHHARTAPAAAGNFWAVGQAERALRVEQVKGIAGVAAPEVLKEVDDAWHAVRGDEGADQ